MWKKGTSPLFPAFFLHGTWWEKAKAFHTIGEVAGFPHVIQVESTGKCGKRLAEFAPRTAQINQIIFLTTCASEKFFSASKCAQWARAVGRNPLGRKVVRLFASYFHCFALMLVVISFTVSAKAGSERICFSTLSRLCSTVV